MGVRSLKGKPFVLREFEEKGLTLTRKRRMDGRIRALQQAMNQEFERHGDLHSTNLLHLSQQLDLLIVEYHRFDEANYKSSKPPPEVPRSRRLLRSVAVIC